MIKKTVFTDFSKAVKDSVGLSFSRSARDNCDTGCRLWDACYASRIERIYTGLNAKLAKHYKRGPLYVVNRAIAELGDRRLKWARLSVDGSLPPKSSMPTHRWRLFTKRLRHLVTMLLERGAKIHVPVESLSRARAYRKALQGLGVVVRRTSQSKRLSAVIRQTDPRAWVVAKRIHRGHVSREEKQENISTAYRYAAEIRRHGQTAVVCPAIAGDSKCGQCTACADACVDVVLYPFHP